MDELFKKTNEFLVEFYKTLKELEESIRPTGSLDEYDYVGELDYFLMNYGKRKVNITFLVRDTSIKI
jgi:hypothetical protein